MACFSAPFLEFDMAEPPEVNQRIAEVLFEDWIIAFLRIGSAWAGPSLCMHNMQYLTCFVLTCKRESELLLVQSIQNTFICINHKKSPS